METFYSTIMATFNTTVIRDDDKNIQNICPRFNARTPYLIIFISSTISIWSSVIIFACSMRKNRDDQKYEPSSMAMSPITPESERTASYSTAVRIGMDMYIDLL